MTNLEFKTQLERRTKEFAVAAFKYLDALPKKVSTRVIAYQLGKSASSIGANYREANRGEFRSAADIAAVWPDNGEAFQQDVVNLLVRQFIPYL